MATIDAVQAAIADCLSTIEGLRVTPIWPDQINLPAAWPMLSTIDYVEVQGAAPGDATLHFDLYVVVAQGAGLARAQGTLNEYVTPTGPRSIPAALLTSTSLAVALTGHITATRLKSYGVHALNQTEYCAAILDVTVYTADE